MPGDVYNLTCVLGGFIEQSFPLHFFDVEKERVGAFRNKVSYKLINNRELDYVQWRTRTDRMIILKRIVSRFTFNDEIIGVGDLTASLALIPGIQPVFMPGELTITVGERVFEW